MGVSRVLGVGLFTILIAAMFSIPPVFAYDVFILTDKDTKKLSDWMQYLLVDTSSESQYLVNQNSENKNGQYTKPTFGLDHERNQKVVDSGFQMNNQTFSIKDNFYTPFQEQTVNIGEENIFEVKIFAVKGLKVQEFLFGVPKVGEAHLAEVGVEVWFGYDGNIQKTKVIQKSNVIDEKTLVATHEKTKCLSSSAEEKCDLVRITVKFLEPLKDKVMALKAIDYKSRYQITYLNDGMHIAGDSLNPMRTEMIPSQIKGEGLIQVTQISKYSPYWSSKDGRMFEKNNFGSFNQVNYEFNRFHDDGDVRTRNHSEFVEIINYEKNRAAKIFDATELISEIPESFQYNFELKDRINEQIKQEMLLQEEIAKKTLEKHTIQARW